VFDFLAYHGASHLAAALDTIPLLTFTALHDLVVELFVAITKY